MKAELLSPSLLSLHSQGNGLEKAASLPSLLKGINSRDRNEWMNLIFESVGMVDEADRIERVSRIRIKQGSGVSSTIYVVLIVQVAEAVY